MQHVCKSDDTSCIPKLSVQYRLDDGSYSRVALDQINLFFGMPAKELNEDYSLRLISLIDYLEDHFFIKHPQQTISVLSGYRSPAYNESLRKKGKLAGETSYHMNGMAADLLFSDTPPQEIWNYVRTLNCCGVGIYGGKEVHIDVGRARFWTASSALPKDKTPPQNKNIYLSIDKDFYVSEDPLHLFFSGISEWPIGVKKIWTIKQGEKEIEKIEPQFLSKNIFVKNECVVLPDRYSTRQIFSKIPKIAEHNKLTVEVEFCDPKTPKMPSLLKSREWEMY